MPRKDPPSPVMRRNLRAEALALKARRARGHLATTAWAGAPGTDHDSRHVVSFDSGSTPVGAPMDHGLRVEIAIALLHQISTKVDEPLLWLTRSGGPDLCSPDLAWLSASRLACAELGLQHSFALVTREGWHHEPSGTAHHWKRLRA